MDEFCQRTHLSGFRYLECRIKEYRLVWGLILSFLYISVSYETYKILSSYLRKDYITTVQEVIQSSEKPQEIHFPMVSICHTGNFNKTFVAEQVILTDAILEKAARIGLDKDGLIHEFIRYMNLFSVFVYAGEFEPAVWDLMNEIYDNTFRGDVHFSDFINYAIHRQEKIISNCRWGGERFRCYLAAIPIDLAACYHMLIKNRRETLPMKEVGIKNALKFEISVPMEHTASSWSDDQMYGVDELGLRLSFCRMPSPLDSPSNIPANSYTIVRLQLMKVDFVTDCTPDNEDGRAGYTAAGCMKNEIVKSAKELCECEPIIGDHFPRNAEVCSPKLMRNCVQKQVMGSGKNDVVNETWWIHLKKRCREACEEYRYIAHYSFYSLEAEQDKNVTKNRFTIFYDSTDYLTMMERSARNDMAMAVYLGGVWMVYTGMSVIALVHAVVLIIVLGMTQVIQWCGRKFFRTEGIAVDPRICGGGGDDERWAIRVFPLDK